MYPRQRPNGLNPQEVLKWKTSKMEWYKVNQPVDTWPWSVLRTFQKEYGISQSGARELQNERVVAFLKNAFVSSKDIAKKTDIPSFTRYPFILKNKSVDGECSILHVHKDVLKSSVLMRLYDDPQSIYALMLTCKDLQGICQEMLCFIAQQRFGPQGTPKALMLVSCTVLKTKKQKISHTSIQKLKKNLGLTGRDFKVSNVESDDVNQIVQVSLKKYGLVDNLALVHENESKKKAYQKQEQAYIMQKIEERVEEVNARFLSFGYKGLAVRLSEDKTTCVWADSRIPDIMKAFQEDNDYRVSKLLGEVCQWVFMKTDSRVGVPGVGSCEFNIAMTHMGVGEKIHPLAHLMLQTLADIKHRDYFFYDGPIGKDEWEKRVANVFSPDFLQKNPVPNSEGPRGSWLCCWMRESSYVRLYCIADQMQFSVAAYYERMRVFENRYQTRLGIPSTGMSYTFNVPRHMIEKGHVISFAHVLLTKHI
jgi:hypothetical protein